MNIKIEEIGLSPCQRLKAGDGGNISNESMESCYLEGKVVDENTGKEEMQLIHESCHFQQALKNMQKTKKSSSPVDASQSQQQSPNKLPKMAEINEIKR
mmetsp:Transcript_21070/g.32643  ORF Transcript_21070/g.32643 Transcript_21070/m.32643 type:complete len:99 (+) Transcript_21070:1543-1839(+)|eukprot:CAMPEP_0170484314 /NCGR_PEP_ID=MMETSP0208-20121228/3810_1 /TAXON_ID=197538 /ORGANISM="Strombidium inclinatum, Strain S3" /LENGTH=98 /DNA_ID=CAMNT_0010757619 /DNA_START=1536 /DNA_END=1832 /DNA_ORIENTATION=+